MDIRRSSSRKKNQWRCEFEHLPPSDPEVKNEWSYTSTLQYEMACTGTKAHLLHTILFRSRNTLFLSCLKIDLLFSNYCSKKYFAEFPHLRVSFIDVVKYEAILLILMIILSCPNAGEVRENI